MKDKSVYRKFDGKRFQYVLTHSPAEAERYKKRAMQHGMKVRIVKPSAYIKGQWDIYERGTWKN